MKNPRKLSKPQKNSELVHKILFRSQQNINSLSHKSHYNCFGSFSTISQPTDQHLSIFMRNEKRKNEHRKRKRLEYIFQLWSPSAKVFCSWLKRYARNLNNCGNKLKRNEQQVGRLIKLCFMDSSEFQWIASRQKTTSWKKRKKTETYWRNDTEFVWKNTH